MYFRCWLFCACFFCLIRFCRRSPGADHACVKIIFYRFHSRDPRKCLAFTVQYSGERGGGPTRSLAEAHVRRVMVVVCTNRVLAVVLVALFPNRKDKQW